MRPCHRTHALPVRSVDILAHEIRVEDVVRSIPNDITLAKALFALSPSAQEKSTIASEHGVDLILGGHDHLYYVSRGVTEWKDYDTTQTVLGAEEDKVSENAVVR